MPEITTIKHPPSFLEERALLSPTQHPKFNYISPILSSYLFILDSFINTFVKHLWERDCVYNSNLLYDYRRSYSLHYDRVT